MSSDVEDFVLSGTFWGLGQGGEGGMGPPGTTYIQSSQPGFRVPAFGYPRPNKNLESGTSPHCSSDHDVLGLLPTEQLNLSSAMTPPSLHIHRYVCTSVYSYV